MKKNHRHCFLTTNSLSVTFEAIWASGACCRSLVRILTEWGREMVNDMGNGTPFADHQLHFVYSWSANLLTKQLATKQISRITQSSSICSCTGEGFFTAMNNLPIIHIEVCMKLYQTTHTWNQINARALPMNRLDYSCSHVYHMLQMVGALILLPLWALLPWQWTWSIHFTSLTCCRNCSLSFLCNAPFYSCRIFAHLMSSPFWLANWSAASFSIWWDDSTATWQPTGNSWFLEHAILHSWTLMYILSILLSLNGNSLLLLHIMFTQWICLRSSLLCQLIDNTDSTEEVGKVALWTGRPLWVAHYQLPTTINKAQG